MWPWPFMERGYNWVQWTGSALLWSLIFAGLGVIWLLVKYDFGWPRIRTTLSVMPTNTARFVTATAGIGVGTNIKSR